MFDVVFYYNQSDYRVVNKVLLEGETFQGVLRANSNLINPSIEFDNEAVIRYNYCYIPEFRRYYKVSSVTSTNNGLWVMDLEVDVLMSFRADINNLTVIVDKQTDAENGDEYIDDGSLVTDNMTFSTVYNFPNGFNEEPEYILITAG